MAPVTFKGLTNGHEYVFATLAENSVGYGMAATVNATPAGVVGNIIGLSVLIALLVLVLTCCIMRFRRKITRLQNGEERSDFSYASVQVSSN